MVLRAKIVFKSKTGKEGWSNREVQVIIPNPRVMLGERPSLSRISPPTPTAASMRAVLATAAMDGWDLQHIDVDQAYHRADNDEDRIVEEGHLRTTTVWTTMVMEIQKRHESKGLPAVQRIPIHVQETRQR